MLLRSRRLSCQVLRHSGHLLSVAVLLTALVFAGCSGESTELSDTTKDAAALLPDNSSVVAMVDLQHVRENAPDGNEMLDRFRNDGPEKLNEALDEMGLDIKEDVHRVYIGGTVRGDDNAPVVLVYGSFDRANIEAYVDSKISESADTLNIEKRDLRGYTTYQMITRSESQSSRPSLSAALVSDALMIVGATTEVEAAVARYDGSGSNALADGSAMSLVREAATGESMWAVATNIPEKMQSSGNERMDRLSRVVRSVSASMTFEGGDLDTRVLLAAEDGADAADIADLTRGLVGLMKRNSNMDGDWQQVLKTIEVSDDGDNVEITARVGRSLIKRETKKMTHAPTETPTAQTSAATASHSSTLPTP